MARADVVKDIIEEFKDSLEEKEPMMIPKPTIMTIVQHAGEESVPTPPLTPKGPKGPGGDTNPPNPGPQPIGGGEPNDPFQGIDLFAKTTDQYDRLRDAIRHAYVVSGHTEKAATTVNAKLPSWYNVLDMKGASLVEGIKINSEVFLENWNPFREWWFRWRAWRNSFLKPWMPYVFIICFYTAWTCWLLVAGKKHWPILACAALSFVWRRFTQKTGVLQTRAVSTVSDWCSNFWESLEPGETGNWLKLPKWITSSMRCTEKSYLVGFTARADSIWYPRQCFHNMCKALIKRQLLPPISDDVTRARTWKLNLDAFTALFPFDYVTVGETPELLEAFLSRYPKGRRKMLVAAWETLQSGFHYVNAMSKTFVKGEWNLPKNWNKMDPRCISAKLDEYLMETAPVYWDMVKHFCKTRWSSVDDVIARGEHFIYGAAFTADEVGAIVTHYVLQGWHAYEEDFSRYDGHNEVEALMAEFTWYKLPQELLNALMEQLMTWGRAMGITFRHRGKVCSGVANTSYGNTTRGWMMDSGYFKSKEEKAWVSIRTGDDGILLVKKKLDEAQYIKWCHDSGHKVEIVYRPDPDFIEFCSARAVWTGSQYVFAPKFGRIITKTFMASKTTIRPDQMGSYVTQIAEGFKHYYWLPVLGVFCKAIIHAGLEKRKVKIPVNMYSMKMRDSTIEVDPKAVRIHFMKVYNFDPQVLEDAFVDWKPEIGTELMHPLIDRMIEVDC